MFKETKDVQRQNLVVNNNMPELIKGFIKVFTKILSPHTKPRRTHAGVYHITGTSSHAPSFANERHLSQEKTQEVKREFSKLKNNGVITSSYSEWACLKSPIKIPDAARIRRIKLHYIYRLIPNPEH